MLKKNFQSLTFKLVTLVFLGIVPIILGLFFYVFPVIETSFTNERKAEVQASVDIAIGYLENLQDDVEAKKMTQEQAFDEARRFVAKTRYNKTDYLFAYNSKGFTVAHGMQPDMIGTDRSDSKDVNGKAYVQEFLKIEKLGSSGYVDYKFEKVKGGEIFDKVSYVRAYPKWHWIVGSGVYMDVIQKQMTELKTKVLFGIGIISLIAFFIGWKYANSLTKTLGSISSNLDTEANTVSTIANSISDTSETLSASTQQQAAALQETSASIEQTSAMIAKNAENAKSSMAISEKSQATIEEGKKIVDAMLISINEISESNQNIVKQIDDSNKDFADIVKIINEIGNKTKVINDIVFQTKLLSFNASVEAARAGEQGKGFAVVAEEVGNLAQMSGNSAKEITNMLAESIRNVESTIEKSKSRIQNLINEGEQKIQAGSETAKQCGEIFDVIVNNMNQVNVMVAEIASATNEQASGIREITTAVTGLDSVGQQNSAMSQKTSEFADQLRGQVNSLRKMTSALNGTVKGEQKVS